MVTLTTIKTPLKTQQQIYLENQVICLMVVEGQFLDDFGSQYY